MSSHTPSHAKKGNAMDKEMQRKRVHGALCAMYYKGKDLLETLGLNKKAVNEFGNIRDQLQQSCFRLIDNKNPEHWAENKKDVYFMQEAHLFIDKFCGFWRNV